MMMKSHEPTQQKNRRLGFILLSIAACFFFGIIIKEIIIGHASL